MDGVVVGPGRAARLPRLVPLEVAGHPPDVVSPSSVRLLVSSSSCFASSNRERPFSPFFSETVTNGAWAMARSPSE